MARKLNISPASQADMPLYAATLNRIFGEYGEHLMWDPEGLSWWGRTLWQDPGLGWTTYQDGELQGLGLVYCKQATVKGQPLKLLVGAPSGVVASIRGAGHAVYTIRSMAEEGRKRGCDAFILLCDPRYRATGLYQHLGFRRFLVRQPRGRGLDAAMVSTALIGKPWLAPLLAPMAAVRPPDLRGSLEVRPYAPADRLAVRELIARRIARFDYAETTDEALWICLYEECPSSLSPVAQVLLDGRDVVGFAYAIQRRILMRQDGQESHMNALQVSDLHWEEGYERPAKELLGALLAAGKAERAHVSFHLLADHLPRSLQVAHGFTCFSNPPLWMMYQPLSPGVEKLFEDVHTFHELIPYP